MYRRDQEKFIPLRLPNMGLKGGSGSSWVCPVLGVVVVFWPNNEFHSSTLSDSKFQVN